MRDIEVVQFLMPFTGFIVADLTIYYRKGLFTDELVKIVSPARWFYAPIC